MLETKIVEDLDGEVVVVWRVGGRGGDGVCEAGEGGWGWRPGVCWGGHHGSITGGLGLFFVR